MRDALRDLPGPVLALIVAVVVMGAMALITAAFKLDRPARDRSDDDVMEAALTFAGLAFSLLAAFVIFFLANEFRDARSAVQAEAVAAEAFALEASRLPDAFGSELLAEMHGYIETVVADEWPLMKTPGLESQEASDALERVFATFLDPPAGLGADEPRYELAQTGLDQLLDARETRLRAGRGSMSGALWFGVLATGTITGVLALFFPAGAQRWRKWMQVLATGAVLATVLFVLVMLENPYSGSFSVNEAPFERVADLLVTLGGGQASGSS